MLVSQLIFVLFGHWVAENNKITNSIIKVQEDFIHSDSAKHRFVFVHQKQEVSDSV